jgi:hypothetical protein
MKKITLSLSILALMLISFSSCQKDEETKPVTPVETPIITLDELYGTWNFKSLKVDGITYSTCEELSDGDYCRWAINFRFYTNDNNVNTFYYKWICDENSNDDNEFSLDTKTNTITWISSKTTFKIINFKNSTLIFDRYRDNTLIGTYTLIKQ